MSDTVSLPFVTLQIDPSTGAVAQVSGSFDPSSFLPSSASGSSMSSSLSTPADLSSLISEFVGSIPSNVAVNFPMTSGSTGSSASSVPVPPGVTQFYTNLESYVSSVSPAAAAILPKLP